MVQISHGNTVELVKQLAEESSQYTRQWALWSGIGNGAAIVAVLSFATNLPNADLALRHMVPSLWLFLLGVISAGLSLPCMGNSASAAAAHFAEAHNRDESQAVVMKMPEMLSYPRSLANEANKERNEIIARGNAAHALAESAWKKRELWRRLGQACSIVAGAAFALGIGFPLIIISFGGSIAS